MKKKIALLLSVLLIIGQVSFAAGFKHPSKAWTLFPKEQAIATERGQDFIEIEKQIIQLYEGITMCKEVSDVLCPRYKKIAIAYAGLKDFENAKLYMNKHLELTNLRVSQYGVNEKDNVIDAKALLQTYDVSPQVYAFSQNSQKIPYHNSKHEPKTGTYYGRVIRDSIGEVETAMKPESVILIYVEFMNESVKSYSEWFKKYEKEGKVIELAWNFAGEMNTCQEIVNGSTDSYIKDSLKYLNTLKNPVILRIGAEQNCWPNTEPELYKKAYIKIAKEAQKLAPNVALCFSLNSKGDRRFTYADYYPGDEYVDWVGVSLYSNKHFKAANEDDQTQMTYGTGKYSNPITMIKPLVEEFGAKKPIIISECAVGYKFKVNNENLTTYAKEVMTNLYTALPMVYPDVKAIAYFDKNISTSRYDYKLSENSELNALYSNLTTNMPVYIQNGRQVQGSYIKLEDLNEKVNGSLKLGAYLDYNKFPNTNVTFILNDKALGSATKSPAVCDIPLTSIVAGENTLKVVFKNDSGFEKTEVYKLNNVAGTISVKKGLASAQEVIDIEDDETPLAPLAEESSNYSSMLFIALGLAFMMIAFGIKYVSDKKRVE